MCCIIVSTVGWTLWDLSLILRTCLVFSALTLMVTSFDSKKPIADMTYNVFGGTLNLTRPQPWMVGTKVAGCRLWNSLPSDVMSAPTLTVFWNRLKTPLLKIISCVTFNCFSVPISYTMDSSGLAVFT